MWLKGLVVVSEELGRMWKEAVVDYFKDLSHDKPQSRRDRELNPGIPDHQAGLLPTQSQRSVAYSPECTLACDLLVCCNISASRPCSKPFYSQQTISRKLTLMLNSIPISPKEFITVNNKLHGVESFLRS
jgi:hypothetical protein